MILSRLKIETREHHLRVERDLGVMDRELDLEAYGAVLSRLFAFHCSWEPRVAALLDDETFFGPRRKLHLIERDLEVLGVGKPPAAAASALPALCDHADAMGSLYVLEGATLGGQIVAEHVERRLGLVRGEGSAYFRSYGKRVAERWRAFQSLLLAISSPATDDAIVAAAVATFARLHAWLCEPVPPAMEARSHG
jgi:heme oxygenase